MASTLLLAPSARLSVLALSMGLLAACGGAEATSSGGTGGALGGGVTSSGTSGSGGGGGGSDGAGGSVAVSPSAKPVCAEGPGTGGTPDPRADAAGVLSADGHSFLLFGGDTALPVCGQTPKRAHAGDTWLLDTACGGWTEVSAMGGPSSRARHAMALDPTRSRALLFGGRTRAAD